MKIENLRTENREYRTRVAATIIWEQYDRSNQEIYFETTSEFADSLTCNPHAFTIATILTAMRYGEERLYIDAEICPVLQDGLQIIMHWMIRWFGKGRKLVKLEAKTRTNEPNKSESERAGLFFSGGIDSLYTLSKNRAKFTPDSPLFMKDGLLVYGDFVKETEDFQQVVDALRDLAKDTGITLIPVYTNIYSSIKDLDPDWNFWKYEFQGAALAAVAHAFTKRLSTISIASTYDIANLQPWGSHPLIDHHYSSCDLQIRHDGEELSRLEKTKLVADWDVALQKMKVCTRNKPNVLNCGRCEKCLRTKITLAALGKLDKAKAFKRADLSERIFLESVYIKDPYVESCYQDLIEPLTTRGHNDLVKGIKGVITRYHEKDLQGTIKRLDRQFFNGNLVNSVKKIKNSQ